MAARTQNLVLYLPLDEVYGDRVLDQSGDGLNGKLDGDAALVPDSRFGGAIRVEGAGRITVPNSDLIDFGEHDFTVELWVSAAPGQTNLQQAYTSILEKWDGSTVGFPYAIRFLYASGTVQATRYGQAPDPPCLTSTIRVDDGRYHHVAFVKAGPSLRLYVDGEQDGPDAADTTGDTTNTLPLTLGENAAGANAWKGLLSHLRIYDAALDRQQIAEDMLRDVTSAAAYTRSHPIEFSLHDAAGLSVLQVGAKGNRLTLEVRNTSGQAVTLLAPVPGSAPGLTNHHFSLWFRPGALSEASLTSMTTTTPGWAMSLPEVQGSGVVVVYLLSTSAVTLAAGDALAVAIDGIRGATGGNRETQVELGYQQMAYDGAPQGALSGTRTTLLTVANAALAAPIGGGVPFAVSFPRGDVVLNDSTATTDGTPNTLAARLVSVSPVPLTLRGASSGQPTRFVFSFDVAPVSVALTPYALEVQARVAAITASCDDRWTVTAGGGAVPTWEVTPKEDMVVTLGESFTVTFGNILTSAPSGQTNLYVDYGNVPGHADGRGVGVFEKGSLFTTWLSSGRDGPLTISANTTFGGFVETHLSKQAAINDTTITVVSVTGFTAGTKILLLNVRSTEGNDGVWELATVASVSDSTLTLEAALAHNYPEPPNTLVRSMPEYTSVTIARGATLSAPLWNNKTLTGGIIAFYASGTVNVAGTLSAKASGYTGGASNSTSTSTLTFKGPGESYTGVGTSGSTTNPPPPNAGGGGGGATKANCNGAGGGGGGYAAGGSQGTSSNAGASSGGVGGNAYGDTYPDRIYFGSGGGSGGYSKTPTTSGYGGVGGGIILIVAYRVTVSGSIDASGGAGAAEWFNSPWHGGGGGGGAGGSVCLRTVQRFADVANVTVAGGAGGTATGGSPGGNGAAGRFVAVPIALS